MATIFSLAGGSYALSSVTHLTSLYLVGAGEYVVVFEDTSTGNGSGGTPIVVPPLKIRVGVFGDAVSPANGNGIMFKFVTPNVNNL